MPPGATRRLGEGRYLHLATQCLIVRKAETLWEVQDRQGETLGSHQTKRLALESLDRPAADTRMADLAAILAQILPPKPGCTYRVVEVPVDLLAHPRA
jgi:hypothetical protein